MNDALPELTSFIENWLDTDEKNKDAFIRLKSKLETMDDVQFEFIPREGVTYSLRASHRNQKQRGLFVMVDVIEDSPRWLSVCFYGEMINDPDEQGDFVPQGLMGEDAICFDVESYDDVFLQYVESRMAEAHQKASIG